MNRPARPMPVPWKVRLRAAPGPRHPDRREAPAPAPARPGIAARWKPRDRVRAGA